MIDTTAGEANQIYMSFDLGATYTDVSNYVKWDTVEITTRAYNDSYKMAQSQASFTLIYEEGLYNALRACETDVYLHIRHSISELKYDASLGFTTLGAKTLGAYQTQSGEYAMFTGHAPSTVSRTYNGIMDNTMIQIDAVDFSDLLEVPCGDVLYRWTPSTPYQICNPANIAYSILHQLASIAGFSTASVDNSLSILYPPNGAPADTLFAITPPQEDSNVIDVLDVLLHEYGYALSINEYGLLTAIPWIRSVSEPIYHAFSDADMMETEESGSPKQYVGVELTYFPLAEGVMTNGDRRIQLFKDSELPYGSDSDFLGYVIYPGETYPPLTNVDDVNNPGNKTIVYQEYDDTAIRYFTDKTKPANNMEVYRDKVESDFSSMVATWNHVLDFGADAGVVVDGTPQFLNKKARIVFRNTTAEIKDIMYFVIKGEVLYKASERTAKSIDSGKKSFKATATYIFNEDKANEYVKAMASQYANNNYTYTFNCQDRYLVGTLVTISFDTEPMLVEGIIVERKYIQSQYTWEYTVRKHSRAETALKATPVVVPSIPYSPYVGRYRGTGLGAIPIMMDGDWFLATSTFTQGTVFTKGSIYLKTNGTPSFQVVTEDKYVTEAQSDLLALNAVMVANAEPPIPEAENFINNLTTNNLSVRSSKTGGGSVEMLKESAIGMKITSDGVTNVFRAYTGDNGGFNTGDVITGDVAGKTKFSVGSGIVWDERNNKLIISGKMDFQGMYRSRPIECSPKDYNNRYIISASGYNNESTSLTHIGNWMNLYVDLLNSKATMVMCYTNNQQGSLNYEVRVRTPNSIPALAGYTSEQRKPASMSYFNSDLEELKQYSGQFAFLTKNNSTGINKVRVFSLEVGDSDINYSTGVITDYDILTEVSSLYPFTYIGNPMAVFYVTSSINYNKYICTIQEDGSIYYYPGNTPTLIGQLPSNYYPLTYRNYQIKQIDPVTLLLHWVEGGIGNGTGYLCLRIDSIETATMGVDSITVTPINTFSVAGDDVGPSVYDYSSDFTSIGDTIIAVGIGANIDGICPLQFNGNNFRVNTPTVYRELSSPSINRFSLVTAINGDSILTKRFLASGPPSYDVFIAYRILATPGVPWSVGRPNIQ